MTPNLGQGACQAIEDGLVLADLLEGVGDPAAALREYERRRIRRTSPLVREARKIGRLAQRSDAASVWIRNLLVRAMPPAWQLRRMAKRFERPRSD
jgi:2-polyprenyl-6-methoxyphenol hydroxylase-like FAD-dependent oxidoreductase